MAPQISQNMDSLMDKLSNDDGFRAQLMADPVKALGAIGITLDAAHIPAIRNLPAKHVIAIDRLAIKEQQDNFISAIPFFLSGRA